MPTPRVRISCPACGHPLHVRATALGREGLCRFCGNKFRAQLAGLHAVVAPPKSDETDLDGRDDALIARVEVLESELADTLARLADQQNQHRTDLDELEALRGRLSEAESAARELQSDATECVRLRTEVKSCNGALLRAEEDAKQLGAEREEQLAAADRARARVCELETAAAQAIAQKESAQLRERTHHERAEAECIALATQIVRLEGKVEALESRSETEAAEHRGALERERIAREELSFVNSQVVYERDTLARKATKLRERLSAVEAARARAEGDLAIAREEWERERARFQESWQERVASLTQESERRIDGARVVAREAVTTEQDRLNREVARLQKRLAAAERARGKSVTLYDEVLTRWKEEQARWQSERQSLLAEAERAVQERVEEFEIERRALCQRLEAERGSNEEHEALRQESHSLRRLLDESRHERDELLQRAERLNGAEMDASRLRTELAREQDEHEAREREHEAAVATLRQAAADSASDGGEVRRQLEEKDRECQALRASLAAAEGARDEDQNSTADANLERERLQRRLEESEAERTALSKALSDAEVAFEKGRAAIATEVDRLRRFAIEAVRTRDEALRRLQGAQRSHTQHTNGTTAVDPESTKKAKLWLAGVLAHVSNLEVASDHEKSELIDRLRTVQAALDATAAASGELAVSRPRPCNQDFDEPEHFRSALVGWLGEARQLRRDAAARAGRMKSEIKAARNDLALLDRDLVLSEMGKEEAFVFPFDESESA